MATFSRPFKLYLVEDPGTGARRQLSDKAAAEAEARAIALRIGRPLAEVLKPSRYWYVNRYMGDGASKRINTKRATKAEADRWVTDRIVMARDGIAEPTKQTFSATVELWIQEKRTARRAESTLYEYGHLAGLWCGFFGEMFIHDIGPSDVAQFFQKREAGELVGESAKEGRQPKTRTLQKDRILLGSLFRWARRRGFCTTNPVDLIPSYRVEQKDPEALTAEEAGRLLRACREHFRGVVVRTGFRDYQAEQEFTPPAHLYGIVLTALHTLLRFSNVARLTWGQVDFARDVIRIEAAQVKTRRAMEIPMTATLKAFLAGLPRGAPAAPVFGDFVGSVKKAFRSAARRAGLPGLKFHTLRKTGATLLLNAGLPLQVVQAMGGWRKPDVLLKSYAAVAATEKARAVEVLNRLGG